MELTLAMMASEATTRILGVLGFLVLLPLMVMAAAFIGRRVVERRHAHEFEGEVETGGDDDWLQRTTSGSGAK